MRLTKSNPETGEYEYIEKAKTQAEFMAQRKAVIQRLGELEDKASDIAEEIFAEIEYLMHRYCNEPYYTSGEMAYDIAELKKKYKEGGE